MKITFCTIVFNGEFVLKQLIESIYPFAHKIIFVDGVVKYWADKGYSGSFDGTVKIIQTFPDPENKIQLFKRVIRNEKTELCQVYMDAVPEDTDYIWAIDSDEIFHPEDIQKVIEVLKERSPHSISFRSNSFFGGFDHILGGFERAVGFKRILKYAPGCTYVNHRPPTLSTENVPNALHISSDEMADKYGVDMYHYSYVSPNGVHDKIMYYKAAVSMHNCIDNYFMKIWLPWVIGGTELRKKIEDEYKGVHEFKPSYRGECRTMAFTGKHPPVIQRDLKLLKAKFNEQLEFYL
ncbi:MAG: hypothetical protein PHW73_00140 [Atribacterota bacterium]|nr:hypothetical protein [Atribacterota bacterium]